MHWRNRRVIASLVLILASAKAGWAQSPTSPVSPKQPIAAVTLGDILPEADKPEADRDLALELAQAAGAPAPTAPGAITPGATALATPAPATAPARPATSGVAGSNIFAERNSAFALDRNRRPSRTVEFLGDFLGGTALHDLAQGKPPVPPPVPPLPNPNPPPGAHGKLPNIVNHGAILVPGVRSFKIAEQQTPRPVDRVYFFTNYFNDVNGQINREFHSQVGAMTVNRNTFGFEKTFMDGKSSIGAQLPINTLSVADRFSRHAGTTTSVGDLSLISKFALWSDQSTGSIISGGLAFTAPTGPSYFAGNRTVTNLHYAGLTPYVGYIWARDRFFFQGFNSISIPTSSVDVTFLYNDLGVGYYVYRDDDENSFLTALVPTFETHINTPLNHRGGYLRDPAGTPDVVDFTYGLNAFLYENTKVSFGVSTPVTGPRPFTYEIMGNVTYRF